MWGENPSNVGVAPPHTPYSVAKCASRRNDAALWRIGEGGAGRADDPSPYPSRACRFRKLGAGRSPPIFAEIQKDGHRKLLGSFRCLLRKCETEPAPPLFPQNSGLRARRTASMNDWISPRERRNVRR